MSPRAVYLLVRQAREDRRKALLASQRPGRGARRTDAPAPKGIRLNYIPR